MTLVLVLFPTLISSNIKLESFILFLISPKLIALFSVKLSFGPLTIGSLDDSLTPLSKVALVSIAKQLL